ncbi:tRNA-uridine aminocarboxypropyltransferase 2 [Gastrophryne carolinensis]
MYTPERKGQQRWAVLAEWRSGQQHRDVTEVAKSRDSGEHGWVFHYPSVAVGMISPPHMQGVHVPLCLSLKSCTLQMSPELMYPVGSDLRGIQQAPSTGGLQNKMSVEQSSLSSSTDTVLKRSGAPSGYTGDRSNMLVTNLDLESSQKQPSDFTSNVEEEECESNGILSDEDSAFQGLSALPVESTDSRRVLCARCRRPEKVCLCPFLPASPIDVSTRLYIVQHPAEESRVLRTVPLLAACLPQDKCKVLIGRRFGEERFPELASVCRNSSTFILYPGAEAANLEELSLEADQLHTLIIIDGTWSQAKDIFYKNSLFRLPKQVQLKTTVSSQYVIRTQPTNTCLSTLECAAIALSIMEKNTAIQETILRPLQALCSFQLQHGAQIHHSKEHLLKSGQYQKPMPKNRRKLKRMELLVNNVKI